ncbi:amidohydrolase family protein, partial [candidate division KSB1 bacterium]
NGSVLIRNGRIEAIGRDLEAPAGVRVVDAAGRWVMPGIIDQHSHLAQASTNEGSSQNSAMVDITDVIVHDDYGIYRALASGVTTLHGLHGSANVIGGRDEVIKLKWGRSREEIIMKNNTEGLKFALGENPIRGDDRFPNSRMGVEYILRDAFTKALEYKRAWEEYELKKDGRIEPSNEYEKQFGPVPPKRDIQLETLVGVLEGKTKTYTHGYSNQELAMFDRIAVEFGFKPTSYEHVLEGYQIADELAKTGSVASIFTDSWNYKVEASRAIPFGAALMYERGVVVSINSDSGERIRRLNLDAAKTIRYGNMPETEVIKTITYNAAYGLRLQDRIGTLEAGKDGDVAIFDAHPLSVYSKCVMTIIEGEVFFDRDEALTADRWFKGLPPKKTRKITFGGDR